MLLFNKFKSKSIEKSIDELQKELKNLTNNLNQIKQQIHTAKKELTYYQQEIGIYEGLAEIQDMGLEYHPTELCIDSIKENLNHVQRQIGEMMNSGKIFVIDKIYTVDGSQPKGQKFQKIFCETLLTGFNNYFEKKRKAITQANYYKTIDLIHLKFNTVNKKAGLLGMSLNSAYLDLCTKLIKFELDEKLYKLQEKEKIKKEKEILREQELLAKEAEKEREKLAKERRMYKTALSRALTEEEKQEFEQKLKEIDKREASIDYRVNNARAGYLYIAATPSMPGTTKIGVTRRLNPLVRIQEISNASVPYPFVCYGLVFDDNVFDLETKIHNYFDSKRTNKINRHKEFFDIGPAEAIKVLKNEFHCEVHFVQENIREDD